MALGGDNDNDDAAGMKLFYRDSSACWAPPAWSKTPERLQEEARFELNHGVSSSCAAASKHDQHNAPTGRERPF